ncbi:MAG: hypothetical protein HYU71_05265 [Bacteroidetes bacterium]|nr:hypothetical protein [Bacteroidota bacterium]
MKNKVFFLILLIALTAFFFARQSVLSSRIIKNHAVVCGKILDATAGKGFSIRYAFDFDGKSYQFNHSSTKMVYESYKNGISTILIALERENPRNHQILFTAEEYSRLKILKSDTINVRCN